MTAPLKRLGRRLGLPALVALVPLTLVLVIGCAGLKSTLVIPPKSSLSSRG